MKSSRNTARQLFALTLTLVGLLFWHILPIPHPDLAVRAASRLRGAERTGQTVSRAVANGRVAFVSSEGNASPYIYTQSDIYTMNPDGSDRKQLTFSQEYENQPAWSPDGTKIAFAKTTWTGNGGYSEIFVMNADGSDQRRLTQSKFDQSPTWSPDGTKIAFRRLDSITMPSSWGIFVMNADGSDQRAVASSSGWQEPAWSPDGLKFAVSANYFGIYLINVDGSNHTQITQPPLGNESFEDHAPAWSPDGSKITFARCVDSNGFGCYTTSHLWGVNADGSNPTKLTDTLAYTHAWSPDGTKIIFGSVSDSQEPRDLFVMNPDGSGLTNITNTDGTREWSPSWQVLPLTQLNPIDDPQFFVRQHYRDFLNREPDAPGLAHWTNEVTMCSDAANRQPGETEPQCVDRKRANTSGAFYLANEFQNSANFLIRVNWGSLGKDGAAGRKCIAGQHSALDAVCRPLYSDYLADLAKLTQGIVVNDALDPNVINTNKRNFVNEFVTRPDFLAAYPNTMTADAYVDKLAQTTGIPLTAQERSDLINKVGTEGRAAVLYDIVDGTITIHGGQLVFNTRYGRAFYDQEFNPAFVFVQYLAYLRRNPDQDGYNHWLGKLNFFGNFVDAEMVRSFLVSDEYRHRF